LIKAHLIISYFNSCRKSRAKKGNVGRPPGRGSKRKKVASQDDPAQAATSNAAEPQAAGHIFSMTNSPGPVTRR